MTDLRTAAQQALEALENTSPLGFNMESDKKFFAAITALRAALAEPVQEPVAWMTVRLNVPIQTTARKDVADEWLKWGEVLPLYTSPPQRKPLTEEEIKECERQAMVNGSLPFEQRVFFARAIERAHGIGEHQ